jgi:hypothetical protein
MDWLSGFVVMATMLILRVAIPVAIMAVVVHFIRRLDVKWHPAVTASGGE